MELIWEPDSCREFLGYSFKNCNPKKLGIGLRRTDWNERIISDFNEFRISMIWKSRQHPENLNMIILYVIYCQLKGIIIL